MFNENNVEKRDGQSGSMDVLLQLTLPMVLILAILVISWLAELKRTEMELNQIMEEIKDSSVDNLLNEMEHTVLSLQYQFLIKATENVVNNEKDLIRIDKYEKSLPSSENIQVASINAEFKAISESLYYRFGDRKMFRNYKSKLRRKIEDDFKELVNEYLVSNPEMALGRQGKLRKITEENREKYEKLLVGELEKVKNIGMDAQYKLILEWIESGNDTTTSKSNPEAVQVWRRFSVEKSPELAKKESDRFTYLLVDDLVSQLHRQKVDLITDTIASIKQ